MGKGRKQRNKGEKPSLEMTPMIDVVFQLLIFFIVTIKPKDILANLDALRPSPDPAPPKEINQEPITIAIGPQGFFFQGSLMTEARLATSLQKIARLDPNTTIIVKCTGDSPHGLLVRALDTCNSVNLRNLSVFSM
jgi:biopolymer transport protein ExbD